MNPVAFMWAIVGSYLAILSGFIVRLIQDDKDGCRDGFDDSEEVK